MTEKRYEAVSLGEIEDASGWAPIRKHLGVQSFGINAWTVGEVGERIIPEHDETPSGQQELYFVHAGAVKATVDGTEVSLPAGSFLHCEPEVVRALESTGSPTTLLVIGGAPGKAYEVGPWEQ